MDHLLKHATALPDTAAAAAAHIVNHPQQWPLGVFPGPVSTALPNVHLHAAPASTVPLLPTPLPVSAVPADLGASMTVDPPRDRKQTKVWICVAVAAGWHVVFFCPSFHAFAVLFE